MNKVAVDTNVIVYLHDKSDPRKREIAKSIMATDPAVPVQVVSEYLNTVRKLLNLSKEDLLSQAAGLFRYCKMLPTLPSTLQMASALVVKYRFQLFDAVIVASCLENGCSILYSEDMQHELVVNNILTIINPFL